MISAKHVPGKLNTIPDTQLRVFNDTGEWKIDCQTITPFQRGCAFSLFGSRLNAQLPKYVSWRLELGAVHYNALTMNVTPYKGYPFPPFNLIPSVLNKVTQDKAEIILVTPLWQAQPWWLLFLSFLVGQSILILSTRYLMKDPTDPPRDTPNVPQTTISCVSHLQGQCQAMGLSENVAKILLSASCCPTRKTYQSAWGCWSHWCDNIKERLILFQYL